MSNPYLMHRLDDLARDLDMVVYRLEQRPSDDLGRLFQERQDIQRTLEQLRDMLVEVVREV